MEYIFTTVYNLKAMTAMARCLRKTLRKKQNIRSHILGWIVVVLGLLLTIPMGKSVEISVKSVITWIALAAIVVALLKEDVLNGYFAYKRGLPQLLTSVTEFWEENYRSTTEVGVTEFYYENIIFRSFIQRKTECEIKKIS